MEVNDSSLYSDGEEIQLMSGVGVKQLVVSSIHSFIVTIIEMVMSISLSTKSGMSKDQCEN